MSRKKRNTNHPAKKKLLRPSPHFGLVDADALTALEIHKGEWIGVYQGHGSSVVPSGELLCVSRSAQSLRRKLKQRQDVLWPVSVRLARTKEELSAPAPLAQSRKQRPRDWYGELRQAENMEDGFGFLTFGEAWDAVRQLAQANDAIDQEKRIDSLWRMYPEAAKQLGLPDPPKAKGKPSAESTELIPLKFTERENKILDVIRRRSKGVQYCRELDNAGLRPPKTGAWKGAPGTYPAAYLAGEPWRHRIQDEKSKIKRKADSQKLANTCQPLAGE